MPDWLVQRVLMNASEPTSIGGLGSAVDWGGVISGAVAIINNLCNTYHFRQKMEALEPSIKSEMKTSKGVLVGVRYCVDPTIDWFDARIFQSVWVMGAGNTYRAAYDDYKQRTQGGELYASCEGWQAETGSLWVTSS